MSDVYDHYAATPEYKAWRRVNSGTVADYLFEKRLGPYAPGAEKDPERLREVVLTQGAMPEREVRRIVGEVCLCEDDFLDPHDPVASHQCMTTDRAVRGTLAALGIEVAS